MKNSILSLLTAAFIVSCSDKKADTNTHIAGDIKGLTNGTLYLKQMKDTALVAIDSLKIAGKSNFEFNFNLDSPELMYLVIDRGITNSIDDMLPIFAETGTINVQTDLKHFYADAKITGSQNHTLLEQFQKINTKYKNEILSISKEKYDAIRYKRLQDVDSIDRKMDKKIGRKYFYAINFALTNKDHEIAPFIALSELTDANIKYLDTINNSLTPKVAGSKYGKLLKKYISERKVQH